MPKEEVPQEETQMTNSPPKTNWGLVGGGVALIILFGIIGLWLYQNSQPKTPSKPITVAPLPTKPVVSPMADEAAGWRTFRNESCSYEIKYPTTWFLSEEDQASCYGVLTSYKSPAVQVKDPEFWKGKLKIEIGRFTQIKPGGQTLDQWLKDYESSLPETLTDLVSQEFVTLAGSEAIKQTRRFKDDQTHLLFNHFLERGDQVYFISAGGDPLPVQETLDQVLASFKFLD